MGLGKGLGRDPGCCNSLDLPGVDDLEALKAKNIKQTELVADLREAILRVARHFQCTDPKNCSVVSCGLYAQWLDTGGLLSHPEAPISWWAFLPPWQELTPDYSMESHQRDHENYVACSRSHRRRAKALLDFERHDDDELGFRKNDIITVRGALQPVAAGSGSRWACHLPALRMQPAHPAHSRPPPAECFPPRPGQGGNQMVHEALGVAAGASSALSLCRSFPRRTSTAGWGS